MRQLRPPWHWPSPFAKQESDRPGRSQAVHRCLSNGCYAHTAFTARVSTISPLRR